LSWIVYLIRRKVSLVDPEKRGFTATSLDLSRGLGPDPAWKDRGRVGKLDKTSEIRKLAHLSTPT